MTQQRNYVSFQKAVKRLDKITVLEVPKAITNLSSESMLTYH